MAHFAELDKDNKVIRVIVVHNNEIIDQNGQEQEELGIKFCQSIFGSDTNWKQTSYNENFRKNFALSGYIYDSQKDAFYSLEAPAPDMEFDSETCKWKMKSIGIEKL